MADQLQLRGGTTAQNNAFTGAQREVTVDTDLNTLVVHDNITPGGFPLASRAQVNNGTFYFDDDTGGGSVSNAYILSPKVNTNRPTAYLDGIQFGFTTNNANTGPSTASFSGLGVKSLKYADGSDPLAGDISGRVYLIYDAANDWLEIQRKAEGADPQIREVGASVQSNAMTVTLEPCTIDFRAATQSSGIVNSRRVVSQLSLVIPAGATLGTTSAVASTIVVVAIDNAGTVELAVVNLSGVPSLNESGLINTTAISAGSSSSNVFYSAAARSGVPYRVMGTVVSTQATAGTWSSSPTQVQGQGGQYIVGTGLNYSAAQNTTSGTSIDFTGIPPGVRRISIILNGVSTNGASNYLFQIGSTSIDVAGYSSMSMRSSAGGNVGAAYTTGYGLVYAGNTEVVSGCVTLTNISGNTWIAHGVTGSTGTTQSAVAAGNKTLTGTLDRVRFTTVNGTDAFDAGSVNIIYEA